MDQYEEQLLYLEDMMWDFINDGEHCTEFLHKIQGYTFREDIKILNHIKEILTAENRYENGSDK